MKRSIIRDDGGDLGLLQHDLRDPHPVGRALQLPWQFVPAALRRPS